MINQVSPFSSFTDFFKPVYSDMDASYAHEGETFSCLRESINLFDFGQRGYTLLPEMEDNSLVFVEREGSNQSWSEIAIRIAKIATIIIPLLKLVGAAIYFLANDFQLQASEDAEDSDNALVEHTFIQIEKTTTPVFDALNEDLIRLFFKYLGPACFQLASTDKRTYGLMNADPSLERFRIGREILKQCFALEFTARVEARGSLIRSLCAFDLQAAFERANLNNDLKYRVSDLVVVSDAFAKFDEKKSSEVLEHAYKEIYSLGQRAKSLFGAVSKGRIECYDRLAALKKLVKPFEKKSDLEKVNKIVQEIQREFPDINESKESKAILQGLEIYEEVDYLKCCEALTIEKEKENISLNIVRIKKLFEFFPEKAEFLVEDLLEFLDKFIEKFPQGTGDRVGFLLELSLVIALRGQKARGCELAKLAMSESESIEFNDPEFHITYVFILLICHVEKDTAIKAINRAYEQINLVEKKDFFKHIDYLISLCNYIKLFRIFCAKGLVELTFNKIPKYSSNDLSLEDQIQFLCIASNASQLLVSYNLEQSIQMFNLGKEILKVLKNSTNNLFEYAKTENEFVLILSNTLQKIAIMNPILAKEMAEEFESPCLKLIALSSVVQGIIANVNLPKLV